MIHLHRHSDDSLLDGCGTAFQFAEVAAEHGQWALAQTDHGNVNGALKHIKACQGVGITPICGVEAYWRPDRRVREAEWRYRRWHLILLAKNLTGWHNLLRITSEAYATGFYQNPCVDDELLEKYGEGLICSASCILGPVSFLIENGTDRQLHDFIQHKLKVFGTDGLWLEIHPHDFDRQRAVNIASVSVANQYGFGYYVAGDAHYPRENWSETQKVAVLIGMNRTLREVEEINRQKIARGEEVYELWHEGLHLMSEQEMRQRFATYHPNLGPDIVDIGIKNTHRVASLVEPYLMDRSLKMPRVTESIDEAERVVRGWVEDGLRRVGKKGDPVYERQIAYELEVIKGKRFFDYFYMVGDFVRWMKSDEPLPPTPQDPFPNHKKPIRVGSGRGSGAGSLVSYCIGITTLDPIAHKFKFERFINPHRAGLPDFDIDVPSSRRSLCKEYIYRRYGKYNVADFVSYSTFQPRAALQRVTKALYGYDSPAYYRLVGDRGKRNGITDRIDPVHDTNLYKLRDTIEGLDSWARDFPDAWDQACRLENHGDPLNSQLGKHAGGVAILPGLVTDYMATIRADERDDGFRTAWSETTRLSICDDFGIVKLDILGITGLDQQQNAIDSVFDRTGEVINLDELPPLKNPRDVDPRVMDRFQRKKTLGVNQFERDGVAGYLGQMYPVDVVDLTAANALWRPGPIGSGGPWRYARRKNGREPYEIHPLLQDVVGDTHGILSFQEQIMDIFMVLAGYDAGQADGVRKIISKLYRDKSDLARTRLEALKAELFEKAAPIIGLPAVEALWEEILPYSFNRAHAGGYTIQGYQDMWLKVYYPLDFYASLLTLEPEKALPAAREAREFGIALMPPDVNKSNAGFTVDFESSALRYGLEGIRGVGPTAAKQIMSLRPFVSIEDFMERNTFRGTKVNKRAREIMINVGALDSLGARVDWTRDLRAEYEDELLGMSLSPGGTLGEYEEFIASKVHSEEEFLALEHRAPVAVGGRVRDIRMTTVKRGRQKGRSMCFIDLGLGLDSWSVTCFPDVYDVGVQMERDLGVPIVSRGARIMIQGRKDARNDGIIANAFMTVDEFVREVMA